MGYFDFFVNDTATTEIYTYCHTLSLHDALPILGAIIACGFVYTPIGLLVWWMNARSGGAAQWINNWMPPVVTGGIQLLIRSEEHTSELQSLMRISYAVFCLKKKKNKQPRNSHHLYESNYTLHNQTHDINI